MSIPVGTADTKCRHWSGMRRPTDTLRYLVTRTPTETDESRHLVDGDFYRRWMLVLTRKSPHRRRMCAGHDTTRRIGDLCVTHVTGAIKETGEALGSPASATYVRRPRHHSPHRRLLHVRRQRSTGESASSLPRDVDPGRNQPHPRPPNGHWSEPPTPDVNPGPKRSHEMSELVGNADGQTAHLDISRPRSPAAPFSNAAAAGRT
ncbi:hypothetical protein BKA23_0083 [Rudaeicoccus suwonensis]|uniref:Uncharacterized protein n=1 Tax=Rudaeicoccus suwonensis TaxID=657409 RepID=A0A561E6T8_9MICO|nr:hypothetical protein BKA23_0083 [Rudaeicoccus suwonensis]